MSNMAQAIRMALHVGESKLGVKDIFGQDVGAPLGGVFTATQRSPAIAIPIAMPIIPRSSSGVFQAFFKPWVAVKTPPSGAPTS